MLVGVDSPLRRLPVGLDREQTLFIDGVRVSAEIVDLVYPRLIDSLYRLSDPDCPQAERHIGVISAVQDAWATVDAVHRIRCLLRRMPRVKKRSVALQVLLRATENVEPLRNVIQHLDSEIPKLLKLGAPAWGTLQWLVLLDRKTFRMRTCAIAAGTAFGAEHELQNPAGKTLHATVDHVILRTSTISVDLSDLFRAVSKFVHVMETTLQKRFPDVSAYGSDLVTSLEMQIESLGADRAV